MTSLLAHDGPVATRQPHRWAIPACALAGLGLGLLLLGLRSPTYESVARVTVNNPIGTMQDEAVAAGASVIFDAAASTLGFEPDVSVDANEVARLLTITSRADTPSKAADAANAVANTYVQAQTTAAVGVASPAEPNDDPVGPGALSYMLIGSLAGALAGVILSGVMMVLRGRPGRRKAPGDATVPTRVPMGAPAPAGPPATSAPPGVVPMRAPRPATGAEQSALHEQAVTTRQPTRAPTEPSAHAPASPPRTAHLRSQGSGSTSELSNAFAAAAAEARAGRRDDTPASAMATGAEAPYPPSEVDERLTTRWSTASSFDELTTSRWGEDPPTADRRPETQAAERPRLPVANPPRPPASDQQSPSRGGTNVPGPAAPDVAEPAVRRLGPPAHVPNQTIFTAMAAAAAVDAPRRDEPAALRPADTSDEIRFHMARHELEVAALKAGYERSLAELRSEIGGLNRRVRAQTTQLKRLDDDDQNRVGDLEAQIAALDTELAGIRDQLERERIANTRRLTEERVAADRALDNARREYREELAKHEQVHRATISEHRADLDRILAEDRAQQDAALEAQHRSYETALENEREHRSSELAVVAERHKRDLADAREQARLDLARQATQHKETITSLRDATERSDAEIAELQKMISGLRTEIATLQQQARIAAAEHAAANQRLIDQLAVSGAELTSERERNAALRADVLRRSAEAHEVVDRALEERTAQLAGLEAAVARQREYSDARVREVSAAAEERARQSALREADLSAKVSRLERELAQLRSQRPTVDTDKPAN